MKLLNRARAIAIPMIIALLVKDELTRDTCFFISFLLTGIACVLGTAELLHYVLERFQNNEGGFALRLLTRMFCILFGILSLMFGVGLICSTFKAPDDIDPSFIFFIPASICAGYCMLIRGLRKTKPGDVQ